MILNLMGGIYGNKDWNNLSPLQGSWSYFTLINRAAPYPIAMAMSGPGNSLNHEALTGFEHSKVSPGLFYFCLSGKLI